VKGLKLFDDCNFRTFFPDGIIEFRDL